MKIYVACDLEGTAGVINHRQQCCWDLKNEWFAPYYPQARRLATLELNALVEGALEGGATEIIAWDGHGSFPGGLDVELLHPACKLLMGAGDGGMEGIDDSFDALFQLGLHAMAGTTHAVMSHSFWGGIAGYYVNGEAVGEIWMNAYTAGMRGVPFAFMSGDRAGANEAQALVSGVTTAVVKEGISPQAGGLSVVPAVSLAPERAREMIRETAREAMSKIGTIEPLRVEGPFTLRIEFTKASYADATAARPGTKRVDEMTVEMVDVEAPWLLL